MLFATVEAANLLGFEIVAVLVAEFFSFIAKVALGVIILWPGHAAPGCPTGRTLVRLTARRRVGLHFCDVRGAIRIASAFS